MNRFLTDPYLFELTTDVADARELPGGGGLVSLAETVVRAAGGGQPADHACLIIDGTRHRVSGVVKADGRSWLVVPTLRELPQAGTAAVCAIDEVRRRRLTRLHTLTHLLMAGLRWTLDGYESRGADLDEDATHAVLRFSATAFDPLADLAAIDIFARTAVAADLPVTISTVRSLEAAAASYPQWRIDPSLALTGRVRVVEIGGGVDANPCSGTHTRSCREIGPFSVLSGVWRLDLGCYELLARREEAWCYWYGEGVATTLEAARRWPHIKRTA